MGNVKVKENILDGADPKMNARLAFESSAFGYSKQEVDYAKAGPTSATFTIFEEDAKEIVRLAALAKSNDIHKLSKFDGRTNWTKNGQKVNSASYADSLNVSPTEFWFSSFLTEADVEILTERQSVEGLVEWLAAKNKNKESQTQIIQGSLSSSLPVNVAKEIAQEFGINLADDKLIEFCNSVAREQQKMLHPRVLVVVSGGIADPIYDKGVDVEVFDWDNYKDAPEETGGVSAHFHDLAEPCGIPVECPSSGFNPNTLADGNVDVQHAIRQRV